jgi:uncharacterized protein YceK
MKALIALAIVGVLAGCGTVNTVFRNDVVTSDNLKEARSFCGAVPRVYSGVVYDFCLLHGEAPKPGRTKPGPNMNLVALDMGASAILDTLVLPYTFYRQHNDGGIEVVGH